MGKIRVKTYGEEESPEEKEQKKREKEAKKAAQKAAREATASTKSENQADEKSEKKEEVVSAQPQEEKEEKKKKAKKVEKRPISKKYSSNLNLVKKDSLYPLAQAIELLKSMSKAKFDETVELHLNVKEKGITGQVSLPHGTGKQIRIKIADDALIEQVGKGIIDFDVLVAEPQMMPKLARVARILGPKGLMPNPKAGTISPKPQEVVEKLSKGQVNYKTEAQAPIIHLSVGKLSFDGKKLEENVTTVLSSVGQTKISSATLKSTMSPGIRLQIA